MAGWPLARVVFGILGVISLLASMAMIYASIGLGFLTAFADAPASQGPDWRIWMLGGVACLILSATLFWLVRRRR